LHLDIWWRDLNLAQDAGTYLYNAPLPWDNSLTSCQVHNTVSVNGLDQMRRAGRFLYLDWAQAEVDGKVSHYQEDARSWRRLTAQHDGYRNLGVIHRRSVEACPDGNWVILDSLLATQSPRTGRSEKWEGDRLPSENRPSRGCSACIHWLLPDWTFEVEDSPSRTGAKIRVSSPHGWVGLVFSLNDQSVFTGEPLQLQIVRAGELVYGSGAVPPILGWSSPTYGVKIPALSVRVTVDGYLPFSISSNWIFPEPE